MTLKVIMGPTASGKSQMALETALACGGEIVSVDSMQLYRGLEIGTAQPTAKDKKLIPHHLVGVFDFQEKIDVYRYCQLADAAIADIMSRGKTPVLVGGSGFYFKALLRGLDDLPGDAELRKSLDEKYDSDAGEKALIERLAELDPAALEKFRTSRRRMIRSLEVRLLTGKSLIELQKNLDRKLRYDVDAVVLDMPPEKLSQRIALRAEKMLANGWIEEGKAAIEKGVLTSPTAWQAIGYAQINDYLCQRIDRDELLKNIIIATNQYARRQRTWFRHQHPEAKILPV